MLRLRNIVIDMKNAFDRLISSLDANEKISQRISEHKDMTIEISKIEKQREKRVKKQNRLSRSSGKAVFV